MSRTTWKREHPYCFLCERAATQCHEIARGPHRKKALREPATWIASCPPCHSELDGMSIARQLAYKALHDLEHYDRIRVNKLRCRQPDAVSEQEVLAAIVDIIEERMG